MSTDPAMFPTATGYDLVVKLRPAHRAVMTGRNALLNFESKAGQIPQPEHGAHWAPLTGWTAWLAEEAAQEREIIRDAR